MKLLLVEDEIKLATTLKSGLEESGFKVTIQFEAFSALETLKTNTYDVIISDIAMPLMNGLQFVREVRKIDEQTPILILSAFDSIENKIEGFNSGIDDYLTKPFIFIELVVRLKSLIHRSQKTTSSSSILSFQGLEINLDNKIVSRDLNNIELTAKEFDLIVYLVKNKNKIVSKKEIAKNVWDIDFDTGTNVIEVYVNYLRNKIDRDFDTKLIQTVHGRGYILKDD